MKCFLVYLLVVYVGYFFIVVVAVGNLVVYDSVLMVVMFYFLVYGFMIIGFFGLLVYFSYKLIDCEMLDDLSGLVKFNFVAVVVMVMFMLFLGGILFMIGFIGKWYFFMMVI